MTNVEHGKKPAEGSNGTNLMVRNLAKNVTDEDLHAFFGGIGPIRSCFVVKDPASGKSKRFGFVRFALLHHAQCAIESLHHSTLAGRRVAVELARERVHARDDKIEDSDGVTGAKKGKKRKQLNDSDDVVASDRNADAHHNEPEDQFQSKSTSELDPSNVQLNGTSTGANETKERQGPRNCEVGAKQALSKGSVPIRTVVLRRRDGNDMTEEVAKDAFSSIPDVLSTIEDVVLVDNGKEARVIFKKWAAAGKAVAKAHGEKLDACIDALRTGERTTAIVRNLPFRVSPKIVEDAFTSVARLRSVRLGPPLRARQDLDATNGADVKNDTIVDCGGYAFVEFFTVSDAKHAIGKINGTEIGGRTVAVDLALPKSKYNHAQNARSMERSGGEVEQSEKDADGGDKSDEDDDKSEQSEDAKVVDGDKIVGKKESAKEAKSSVEELARTVFVRNLLFETKAHVVWKVMEREFGPVEQSVIVKNNATQMSTGKAFVRFTREEDAKAAVRAAEGVGDEGLKEEKRSRKRVKMQSVSSSGLWIDGRRAFISMAMERGQARAAHADRFKEKDVRNLHLASVGSVERGSVEGKGLRAEDWAIRDTAERNKRFKLKKNPNTFVSDKRLCVLNLPRGLDEKVLKAMFTEAAISGKDESSNSKKSRQGTSSTHKNDVRVTHCSIIRDGERKDRSKGFGFVTFEKHEHALRALEAVNNNAHALEKFVIEKANKRVISNEDVAEQLKQSWGGNRRLVVEFAVEDVRQVRVLAAIKEKGRKLREQHRAEKANEAAMVNAVDIVNSKQSGKRRQNEKRSRDASAAMKDDNKARPRKKARYHKR